MALVYARININSERQEISLREKINIADWDPKREMVMGKTIQAKALNEHIENVRYRLLAKYRALEEKGGVITAGDVKQAYLGVQGIPRGRKVLELLDYYVRIWESKLKYGGIKNYRTTLDYIRLFFKSRHVSGDAYLSELNMQTATEFEHYVRHNPVRGCDPCLGNGLYKHIQRFKRILNWAVEIEWLKVNPFEKYHCPLKKSKRKKLTVQDLVLIENKDLRDPALAYVKDLFLFSIFTGLAYADVMGLTEDVFEQDVDGTTWCGLYRLKSDGLCQIPMMRSATAILDKYIALKRESGKVEVFPFITNQYVNRCLSIIREACGIETPMTFHIARHTFAKTIALKNGVPQETVQMVMGHSKINTTQINADVDEEKIFGDVQNVESKLELKRQKLLQASVQKTK